MPRGLRGSYHNTATRLRSPATLKSSTLATAIGLPLGAPAGIPFLFPNGCAPFDFVDRKSARSERGIAMRGRRRDGDRHFARARVTGAVNDCDAQRTETFGCFAGNALELRECHGLVRFIGQSGDNAAVVGTVAHCAEKRHDAPAGGAERREKGARVDAVASDA